MREAWVLGFSTTPFNMSLRVALSLRCLLKSRTVFIPTSSDVDNNGRIVRSAEALRPLTPCDCDSKILTSAICRGLHWYTVRCIHPSQRCISSRQLTDNILEIGTAALAHVACAPRESGILPTDFAAAYPCVSHSWIFSVPEKTEVPKFICRFLRRIYSECTTHVEFAGMPCGQFLRADSYLRWPSTPSFVGSRTRSFPTTLLVCTSSSLFRVHALTTLRWLPYPFVA